jgi:hypothetical protein
VLSLLRSWFSDRSTPPELLAFRERGRDAGIDLEILRTLEPLAVQMTPGKPELALQRRELFERLGISLLLAQDGRNLRFELAERLADALERLRLLRSSDLPDPLRRVRLRPHGGAPALGIVLRPQGPEMLVLLHPKQRFDGRRGDGARLDLAGARRVIEIPVRLTDVEERDGARLLHIARPEGWGNFGRSHERFPVLLPVSVLDRAAGESSWIPGEVFDLSEGGICACLPVRLPVGRSTRIHLCLETASGFAGEPLFAEGRVVWARPEGPSQIRHGLSFDALDERDAFRLRSYLDSLGAPAELHPLRP